MVLEVTNATASDMNSLLETIGTVFTYVIGKLGDIASIVMQTPLLLIPIGVILVATIFAVFRRFF